MKKVLVTGAAGFIGSNLVKYLLEKTNFEIFAIDNLQSGNKIYNTFIVDLQQQNSDRLHFYLGDIKDINIIINSTTTKIDTVFHLAATPRVSYSVEHPLETNENNVSKTLILLDWCVKNKIKRFIFSSSSSVYGNANIFPTSENHELVPISPYALQKKIIEEYCKIYSNLYGLDTVCLRYFNVYGPNQYAENSYATVICSWIKSIIENEPIRIDGDGLQSRDFSYVTDVCKANLLVALHEEVFMGECFNIACNDSTSLLEIKSILESLSKKEIKVLKKESRIGDVFKTQADVSKIKKIGFVPEIKIKQGLEKTYNWYVLR